MRKEIIDWAEENMKRLIDDLPQLEAKVISMYYLQEINQQDIAKEIRSDKNRLNMKGVKERIDRFNNRILAREGMFRATLIFYNAYLGLCYEHRKFLYRQKRDRKRKRQL